MICLFKKYLNNQMLIRQIYFLFLPTYIYLGLPSWLSGKESTCQCRRCGFDSWVGKIPRKKVWQPTPIFLPGKSHEKRSLVGYNPWGHKESDTTERLTLSLSLHLFYGGPFLLHPKENSGSHIFLSDHFSSKRSSEKC